MPRLIFKCPYIKGGTSAACSHLENYVQYMATRSGVDRIDPGRNGWPATINQKEMIEQILRDFPLSRGMFEYEDYRATPTRSNASEFITRALEDNYDRIAKMDSQAGLPLPAVRTLLRQFRCVKQIVAVVTRANQINHLDMFSL